jgi:multicomponent K+:H+ antiporter subunit G
MIIEAVTSLFLLLGSAFALVGALGLVRFPDYYTRLHAPTKAVTLGVGGVLVASMIDALARDEGGLVEPLITVFLFITAPVSAHVLAKAGLHLNLPSRATVPPALVEPIDKDAAT